MALSKIWRGLGIGGQNVLSWKPRKQAAWVICGAPYGIGKIVNCAEKAAKDDLWGDIVRAAEARSSAPERQGRRFGVIRIARRRALAPAALAVLFKTGPRDLVFVPHRRGI